jgi:hypothetical protein
MRKLLIIVLLFVVPISLACLYWMLSGYVIDQIVSAHPKSASPVAAVGRVSGLLALLVLLATSGGAAIAYRQLTNLRRFNQLQVALDILRRYLDDRDLFRVRGLVYQYIESIDLMIHSKRSLYLGNRELLDRHILRHTQKQLRYDDLIYLVNTFNFISIAVTLKFIPDELQTSFYAPLMRPWPYLKYLIDFEHQMRGNRLWAKDYYKTGQTMDSVEYRNDLRRQGVNPLHRNHIVWIAGTHLAGKTEFRHHLTNTKKSVLTRRIDLNDCMMLSAQDWRIDGQDLLENYVKQFNEIPKGRALLIEAHLAPPFGQAVRDLASKLPFECHSIVCMVCQPDEILRRARIGGDTYYTLDDCIKEVAMAETLIKPLNSVVSVTRIRSTTRTYVIERL